MAEQEWSLRIAHCLSRNGAASELEVRAALLHWDLRLASDRLFGEQFHYLFLAAQQREEATRERNRTPFDELRRRFPCT